MPLNLLKTYPQQLELAHLNTHQRRTSLSGVFKRDIENNDAFRFRTKQVRPIKKEGQIPMDMLFDHLITREDMDDKGNPLRTRSFEMARSERLHWIKHHIDEQYVVILEPQRSQMDYYLLTAYHLNESGGKRQIEKKFKKKLPEIH
ncbi:MAG: hypothetical protein M0P58_11405 [Bacteroidales bacterium]|nr:hypothetical protein [Bacteroidales bacterium]